jgi:hypothetical protein
MAFRWPMLCDNREAQDPDESQMMSGAMTLNRDPLYWKSVDGQTRGPVDDWALLTALRVAGRLDYTGARLVSVLLSWVCVLCAWLALRHIFTDEWARLLVLPLLAAHAFANSWSYVQYGSEQVTVALIALASALLLTAWRAEEPAASPRRLFLAGLALGVVPFAKLQGVPVAAWTAAFAAWRILRTGEAGGRARNLAVFLGGGLTVPSVVLLWIAWSGIWGDFYESYVLDNLRYAGARWFSWAETPARFWELCGREPGGKLFLIWAMVFACLALLAFPFLSRTQRRCTVFALGLAASSACAAMAPGRMFQHYLQFIFFPAGLLAGIAGGSILDAARGMSVSRPGSGRLAQGAVIGAFLVFGLAPQVAWRARVAQPSLGRFIGTRGALERTAVAGEVLRHARPGESLAVWGWCPRIWVQTGLLQATRDGNTSRQIELSASRTRYRERYLSDLMKSSPPVLVDAVGEGNFAFEDRFSSGHETFGELNDYIRANYRQVGDMDGARVYVRNGRP